MSENVKDLKCPACGAKLSMQLLISSEAYKEPNKPLSAKEIEKLFPKNLLNVISIEENKGSIVVKPKKFLGKERFSEVAAIVKEANGKYVSAGRDSHFTSPR